ncbi:type II secretion system protein GspL [Paraburkholderia sp. SARCC-3016]|uniref:type II secretion system protein GspL n=1 Tax=Paraburkholderia sp. SARCC-3016 TaxID=3058611 RepID=UPI0028083FC7|nr:type II secretion system protein GspL [Paraburkholderia sp. SARCC-3016]MDQ7981652.1 type II secretion system protein GspL [Paraburkholderia sp. SARCC-3016]
MSSLIVLLPSADAHAASAEGVDAMPMPFALLDRSGEITRAGYAALAGLPRAPSTVLIVAARDTLLLKVNLPPVAGPRLRRVLPNVVEEHLIRDAQNSHVAVGPDSDQQGERYAAVVEREWFAGVIERFTAAGHRKLRAVPLVHCIPLPEALQAADQHADEVQREEVGIEAGERDALFEPQQDVPEDPNHAAANEAEANTVLAASALIVRHNIRRRLNAEANRIDEAKAVEQAIDGSASADTTIASGNEEHIEIAVRQGMLGFGMTIRAAQLDATIAELAKRQPLAVYSLALEEASPHSPSTAFPLAALTLPWPSLARDALACRFDLCQFEFANGGRSGVGAGGLKPWRFAIGFVAAALIVSLVAINVQWIQLRHRRDALNAEMTELVKSAFPDATVILDPHAQMATGLARLRSAAGEPRPDDFAVLASSLSRALGSIPSSAIAGLDYNSNALDVTFKAGTTVDSDGLTRRLAAQGLSAQEDNGKWSIRSAQR